MSNVLALYGGSPSKQRPFPEWPMYDEQELAAVQRVMVSRAWWRTIGKETIAFEEEFARYQGGKHALAVTSGTQALELLFAALDIGEGDEVIVPAFTFISTAIAVLNVNAVPVLVDVDPLTYCIDPQAVEAAITSRTKAIVPVHMAGHIADLDRLGVLAKTHGLYLIEDAAHAHGAEWKGERVGAGHTASIFSFQSGKLMTAGEGGLILCNDADLRERCYLFSSCGRPEKDRTYQHLVLGTNARMSELHAAVLRAQLTRLDTQITRREVNAPLLDVLLGQIEGITSQQHDVKVTRHPHYMYMFRYSAAAFNNLPREVFVDALNAEGIPAFVAYPAIHRTPVFQEQNFGPRWRSRTALPVYAQQQHPNAEEIGDCVVWLHHRVLLGDEEDLHDIVDAIKKIRLYTSSQKAAITH